MLLHWLSQLAIMAMVLSAIMTIAWQIQRRTGHTGWIDVCWTFGTGAVAAAASLVPFAQNSGPTARQVMVAILVTIWSLRLGGHLVSRTRKLGDDPRYRELIRQWGADADRRMFLQVQAQAAVALILAVSVAIAAHIRGLISASPMCLAHHCWRPDWLEKPCLTGSCISFAPIPPTTAGSAKQVFGGGRVIRIISSNGCAGWLTR